jgi:hypothetical protein
LALNTSVSAVCRFYTSWNPINQQAKLMEQLGKSLRVCRQATPLASLTGVLAILENNVLKQLSDGKSAELLEKEINLMTRVHRSFISEETLNHKRGQFDSRRDYFKHVDLQANDLIDDDFDYNDRPREDGLRIQAMDPTTPEDHDIDDLACFKGQQVSGFHVPLNAETYKRHIENKRPLPHIELLQAARQQNSTSRGDETHSSSHEPATAQSPQSNTETIEPRSADSPVRSNQTQLNPQPSATVTEIVNSLYPPENSGKIPSKLPVIPQIPHFSEPLNFTAPALLRALNTTAPKHRANP